MTARSPAHGHAPWMDAPGLMASLVTERLAGDPDA
jgi:hypothetical protein